MEKGNAALIKSINLNKLRIVLKEIRSATKPQLAELTGLSVVTINTLLRIMIADKEVIEDDILPSGGGRPAASYRYNEEYQLALVIFFLEKQGKDTACIRVLNLFNEVIDQADYTLEEAYLKNFDIILEVMLATYPQIKIIGLGLPGVEVDKKLFLCDIEKLKNQNFPNHIRNKFHLPVLVENDMNAAVAGYCYANAIADTKCIIGIYFPSKYPPGAGIYLNGQIYKGKHGFAGEVKYLPFDIDWDTFEYNDQEKMDEIMIKTILSFHCMYNPDEIVLYGDIVSDSLIQKIESRCVTAVEQMMMPKITCSNQLMEHFELGIRRTALSLLEPALQIRKHEGDCSI